jgi:hypothetical protein
MFNDRGISVDAAHRVIRGDRYETEDQEKTRYDRFCWCGVGIWRISSLVHHHTTQVSAEVLTSARPEHRRVEPAAVAEVSYERQRL